MTINDTINLFLQIALSILVISNHNSFRALFEKLLPYIFFEKYISIFALEMASQGNWHCANCIGTLSFLLDIILCRPFLAMCKHDVILAYVSS